MTRTVNCSAGSSEHGCRTKATPCDVAQPKQTACSEKPAYIGRPMQVWQRRFWAPSNDPSSPRNSGARKRPDTQRGRCREVEGSVRSLNKIAELYAAVQEPAAIPTIPTPNILSAIKQNRSMNPPEMFLRGGTPSSHLRLRIGRTLHAQRVTSAICLDATSSPRGERRG